MSTDTLHDHLMTRAFCQSDLQGTNRPDLRANLDANPRRAPDARWGGRADSYLFVPTPPARLSTRTRTLRAEDAQSSRKTQISTSESLRMRTVCNYATYVSSESDQARARERHIRARVRPDRLRVLSSVFGFSDPARACVGFVKCSRVWCAPPTEMQVGAEWKAETSGRRPNTSDSESCILRDQPGVFGRCHPLPVPRTCAAPLAQRALEQDSEEDAIPDT
ncbi:hypothetical protein DFH08DRAFT_962315 [Mycena albidolilacea]|uniref:Uncharacterized protein n=1 Tax=Mycena albidolilacea TaxID=1033008 RepID=A0AAD6ZWU1_9AGAR|nr:hypothetical protein DFH08DRAFT_962315 [Mycena albidolilacea]